MTDIVAEARNHEPPGWVLIEEAIAIVGKTMPNSDDPDRVRAALVAAITSEAVQIASWNPTSGEVLRLKRQTDHRVDGRRYTSFGWNPQMLTQMLVTGAAYAGGVALVDKSALESYFGVPKPEAPASAGKSRQQRRAGRRPGAWREAALMKIIEVANTPDGLPYTKADLEKCILDHLAMLEVEASESSVKSLVSEVYDRLDL